jgi:hypothetical protein
MEIRRTRCPGILEIPNFITAQEFNDAGANWRDKSYETPTWFKAIQRLLLIKLIVLKLLLLLEVAQSSQFVDDVTQRFGLFSGPRITATF